MVDYGRSVGGALAVMGAAIAATPAVAADPAGRSGADRVIGSFTACRGVTEADARLACFDKAAAALETAVKAKEVTILDRADVRKTRRSLFGFTLPRFSIFGDDTDARDEAERQEFTQIDTTVKSAGAGPNGRVQITLPDDALWTTIEPAPFPPRAGAKIRIRKGTLGVFFLTFDGRSYRGNRIR